MVGLPRRALRHLVLHPAEASGMAPAADLQRALEGAGFAVIIDAITRHVTTEQARRYGPLGDLAMLACRGSTPTPNHLRTHQHHGYAPATG